MTSTNMTPRGRNYVRSVMLRAQADSHDGDTLHEIAVARWGATQADTIVRAAIAAIDAEDVGANSTVREFLGLVRENTVYGRLSGLRKVAFGVTMPRITSGATANWVGEAKLKPLSKPAVLGSALNASKVVALIATTAESLRMGGPQVENALQAELIRAVSGAWDEAFLDPTNAGVTGERPPSITYGATAIPATADPAADIATLVAAFQGDFGAAYWVMHPKTAARLALRRTGEAFQFPELGPRGGAILHIPALTSRHAPEDVIALIDPTGIAAADDGMEIKRAKHASLLMVDDADDAEPELVSLFQTNTIALMAEVITSWEVQRPGSVAIITGADYAPEV